MVFWIWIQVNKFPNSSQTGRCGIMKLEQTLAALYSSFTILQHNKTLSYSFRFWEITWSIFRFWNVPYTNRLQFQSMTLKSFVSMIAKSVNTFLFQFKFVLCSVLYWQQFWLYYWRSSLPYWATFWKTRRIYIFWK